MSTKPLYQFYLDLIPNLLTELFFFIPEKEIRPDIIEKIDFLKDHDVLNKVYVLDHYQGPMEYKKTRNNKYLLLKATDLETNVFNLLEKKSEVKEHEFNYVLERYFELVECLFYITNWMNGNITQIEQYDNGVSGIFYLQSVNYKRHFESLVKNFYPSRDIVPKGNFNALYLIETYFPDIDSSYNSPKKIAVGASIVQIENQEEKEATVKETKKITIGYRGGGGNNVVKTYIQFRQ